VTDETDQYESEVKKMSRDYVTKYDEECTEKLENMLNSFSFSEETVCKLFERRAHRTIQQTMTRLAIAWIKTCASDDYRYDERNEMSHHLCKEIVTAYNNNHTETTREHFDELRFPMI
jgi:hypothetical protein